MNLSFFVPGIPATAGSKTGFYNKKSGRVIMAPANKRQKPWMSHVQACAIDALGSDYDQPPITGAVVLALKFLMPRAKSHYGTGKNEAILKPTAPIEHIKKPDLTKLLRAVEDALTGLIWRDDSQVVSFCCAKSYTESVPGVFVEVMTADEKPS